MQSSSSHCSVGRADSAVGRRVSDRSLRPAGGFSIIELLIAVIIIGILVAIIIPVLVRRADDARIASAESDLEHLQAAEERACLNTRYMYRFYVLDDTIGGDGRYAPTDPSDVDGIRDEEYNFTVVAPLRMFIDYKAGLFMVNYGNLYSRMSRNETEFGWSGPYINYQRMHMDDRDMPLDPWGNPYLLFTLAGVVDQFQGTIETVYNFTVAATGAQGTTYGPWFDRFTVLSMGPNGTPGDGSPMARFGTADDLYRQF